MFYDVGERSFSHAGTAAWNSSPDNIKLATDLKGFLSRVYSI